MSNWIENMHVKFARPRGEHFANSLITDLIKHEAVTDTLRHMPWSG